MAERGGKIKTVKVQGTQNEVTPDLSPRPWTVSIAETNSLLGIKLDGDQMAVALGKMGFEAEAHGDDLEVKAPAWRLDLIHPVDIMSPAWNCFISCLRNLRLPMKPLTAFLDMLYCFRSSRTSLPSTPAPRAMRAMRVDLIIRGSSISSSVMLQKTLPALEGIADWTEEAIHDTLISLAETLGVKNATLMCS